MITPSMKIKTEKKIAKMLNKSEFDVEFQNLRILNVSSDTSMIMVKADGFWFDVDYNKDKSIDVVFAQ